MPRYPDSVTVVRQFKTPGPERARDIEEEQPVVGMKTCSDCGADIFFAETGREHADGRMKTVPVNAQPDEQGRHRVHWETCDNPREYRRPAVGDRAR